MDGTLDNKRAPLQDGQACECGPYYGCSSSLQSLNMIPSFTLTSILVKKARIKQGTLRYHRSHENKCSLESSKGSVILAKASYWKKKLGINLPISWSLNLYDRGIFGAVGVSQFLHHFDKNVWRCFYELWGPLTNTLHYGAGLPVLESLYDKFLPPNKDLVDHNKYPTTVIELPRIHTELCEFHKVKHIYYDLWLDYFYIKYLVYFTYREQTNSEKEKVENKKRSLLYISCQEQMTYLNSLCLTHGKEVIRLETYVMATLMASRSQISLAPMVLGYVYHSVGDTASYPDHLGKANAIFPSHSVIGWLAELFPCIYRRRLDSNCPGDFPTFVHYVRLLGSKLSLHQARHVFRDGRYLSLRASSYHEDSRNGRDVIDMGYTSGMGDSYTKEKPSTSFSKKEKPRDLLANIAQVSQSLSAVCSMINIYKISTIEIYWLSSKIKEIFRIVETAAKIEELVDVDRVKALSNQDLTCSSEISHIEGKLNNLSCNASKLKVKEQEILREEEWIRKMQQSLIEVESKLKSFLDSKKWETNSSISKLQDLENKKDHLKNLIGFVISFNNA
ncbi:hypothetical protein Cgig2_008304 [Carnegiea gigantea]|uniref:Aminotransferase-like plant mobile domain-containing protein n=1 Tax=Carnegiea gigantea TaxID=171969 RepID=A0A9Q1JHC5_9CARY|nr:hypothetical protein Cgig2_008304 [Carnegiea gigantea]